ncbi:MAG: hypothetical protein KatS3mg076_2447 [Candidatus Binatia bacterium]|nr:MAG: hypothetical protein KatS3mg076_2447 [Candidatus Binatia bacterium]
MATDIPPETFRRKFLSALRRMLRPVVRQLIAYNIPYPAFDRMVRELYVEVAEKEFPLPFKRQTDSRLALVTGLNRKEVAQLRRRGAQEKEVTSRLVSSPVTQVIGRWMSEKGYSRGGTPLPIPYEASDENAPSFTKLVRELRVDIPVRSILDELLRIGAVELRPDGTVVLRREAHIPSAAEEGKLELLATDPAELFRTIVHNIEHPEEPRLQRKVLYDNIGSDALPKLRELGRELGEEFVRKANRLLAAYDRDRNPDAPGGKAVTVSLGVYYAEEETGSPSPSSGPPSPPGRITRSK